MYITLGKTHLSTDLWCKRWWRRVFSSFSLLRWEVLKIKAQLARPFPTTSCWLLGPMVIWVVVFSRERYKIRLILVRNQFFFCDGKSSKARPSWPGHILLHYAVLRFYYLVRTGCEGFERFAESSKQYRGLKVALLKSVEKS